MMPVSEELALSVPLVAEAETAMEDTSRVFEASATAGQLSAPPSPCVPRRPPQTLGLDSRIPQPLISPTPLRRSGSLRLRGEKLAPGMRGGPASGRGVFGARTPGATFPSITEASEQWRRSLRRGSGDGPATSSATTPAGPSSSCLRHERHHRSLQSLASRPLSKDSYPHTPTPSPEDLDHLAPQNLNRFLLDHARDFGGDHDDLDSLRSYGSNCSTQSACDHSQFARNGTTFSGKRMKYIVHCSSQPEPNEYLTPTQRASQQIRRLKALVDQARKDMEAKDENIFKLTKEVVELRLLRDEVDGSPSKTTGATGDSPICKAVTHLESENGNSASLSDSGHFDDILSLTSPQSTHSPGPRHVTSTPESERMAEIYQRKIDEVTKKQGEKSMEDRKCLVEMYEKKMENMSRKSIEKFHQEKNDLVQMYEKKIEDTVRRHQEKVQEERKLVQESYENKIDILSERIESMSVTQAPQHDLLLQALNTKLEEAENRIASLIQQLEEANLRFQDLQHELFQSREKSVLLEEEVETLRKMHITLEQELSDKQVALVQSAALESELRVLQRHMEKQQETSELKSKLENKLAILQKRLKEEECRVNELESERTQIQMLYDEHRKEACQHKSEFEAELKQVSVILSEEQKRKAELENISAVLDHENREAVKQISELRCKLDQLALSFKEEKQKRKELESSKSSFNEDLERMQMLLQNEKQTNEDLEKNNLEYKSLQEEKERQNLVTISQLEQELASVKSQLHEQVQRTNEEENWKSVAQTLKEEATKRIEDLKSLTSHSDCLEEEVCVLKNKLEGEKNKSLVIQDRERDIEELKELLNRSQEEAEEHLQQVRNLTDQLRKAGVKIVTLSNLLTEEKLKSEELVLWRTKAENFELLLKSLQKEVDDKTQQHQYLLSIQDEFEKLKQNLALKEEEVRELIIWKAKVEDLEDKLALLTEEAAQRQTLHLSKASENEEPQEFNSGLDQSIAELETHSFNMLDKNETQQKILLLESEVGKLRESLDQSYWAQSEREILKLEMEKAVAEQTLQLQKLENEVLALNQSISALKVENEELSTFKHERLLQDIPSLSSENGTMSRFCLHEEQTHGNIANNQPHVHTRDETAELTRDASLGASHLMAEIESLRKALADQEERHTEMNLKMYLKGQEAAKFERKDQVLEMAAQSPESVSVPELLTQLAETEKELDKVKDNRLENIPNSSPSLLSASEAVCLYLLGSFKAMYRQLAEGQANSSSSPEATLLFLKSAVYYFLTDEANCQGHLHAIQSILGFTESEKQSIDTLTYIRR